MLIQNVCNVYKMHLNILNRYASACTVCVHVQYRCIPWCEESRNITGRPHTGIHAGIAPCRPPPPPPPPPLLPMPRLHLHVLHGIFKQHQVHHGVDLIVRVQRLLQNLLQGLPRWHRQVLRFSNPRRKVAVYQRLCFKDFLVHILVIQDGGGMVRVGRGEKNTRQYLLVLHNGTFMEFYLKRCLHDVSLEVGKGLHVLILDHLVPIDPAGLVQPYTHQVQWCLEAFRCGEQNSLRVPGQSVHDNGHGTMRGWVHPVATSQ